MKVYSMLPYSSPVSFLPDDEVSHLKVSKRQAVVQPTVSTARVADMAGMH